MENRGLQISKNEKVIKRYDFIVKNPTSDGSTMVEDSLIITEERVIRRVVGNSSYLQNEMLARDVNRVNVSCKTTRKETHTGSSKAMIIMIVIACVLFVAALVMFFEGYPGVGIGLLVPVAILVILAFTRKEKTIREEYTTLKVHIYSRTTDQCVISIEKRYRDRSIALNIADGIGVALFGLCPSNVSNLNIEK